MAPFASSLRSISLRDHRGGTRIVAGRASSPRLVVFVPMAFTPICEAEIGDLVEVVKESRSASEGGGAHLHPEVLLVSTDSTASLRAWLRELGADSVIDGLSDFWPHGLAARAYDAFDEEAGTATRRTFAVRADGSYLLAASAPPGQARARSEHAMALHLLAEGL